MELNNGKFVTIIEYGDISSDGHDITDYFSIISNKEHTIIKEYCVDTDNYSKFILNLLNEEYPEAEFIKLPIIQKYIGYGLI